MTVFYDLNVLVTSLTTPSRVCCSQFMKRYHFKCFNAFFVTVECLSLQGDYNMTPDRHLGAAWIDRCRPDLLITESTYATTIRDSKRCRERDFLKKVHDCVEKGGKVRLLSTVLSRSHQYSTHYSLVQMYRLIQAKKLLNHPTQSTVPCFFLLKNQ